MSLCDFDRLTASPPNYIVIEWILHCGCCAVHFGHDATKMACGWDEMACG